jgi:protease I
MAKVLYLISQDGFQDTEYADSRKELEKAGHQVIVASLEKRGAVGKFGLKVLPDVSVGDVKTSGFDAVVVIGGRNPNQLAENKVVIHLIQQMDKEDKVIAGICMSQSLSFVKAGILKGRKVTGFETKDGWSKQIMVKSGAEWVGGDVVVDGNLITAVGPESAKEFGRKISHALKDR